MMGSTLPSRGDIRNRFLFMYGFYIIIILLFWVFIRIRFIYILPIILILIIVAYANYQTNVKLLTKKPRMSSDDFSDFVGITLTHVHTGGKVRIRGEIWNAVSDAPIDAGKEVEVIGLKDSLTLNIKEKMNQIEY